METRTRKSWAALILILLLSFVLPGNLHLPLCLFRIIAGIPCPGCGLTSSFQALSQKHDLLLAASYHPLGPFLYLLTWGGVFLLPLQHRGRNRMKIKEVVDRLTAPYATWGFILLFLTVWVMRTWCYSL